MFETKIIFIDLFSFDKKILPPNICSILIELSKNIIIYNATLIQAFVNIAAGPTPELVDSIDSIYIICYRLGYNKKIKTWKGVRMRHAELALRGCKRSRARKDSVKIRLLRAFRTVYHYHVYFFYDI